MKFDEETCLRLINEEGADAYGLLIEHAPTLERKFKRVDKALRDLLIEVKKTFPDATYYTASGGFNLLLGDSHHKETGNAQQELTALSGFAEVGDGDW